MKGGGMTTAERNAFVLQNRGLVGQIAKKFRHHKLGYEDLFQEGMVGLLIAADRFDPKRNVKFSTFASWWVRCMILEAVTRDWHHVKIDRGHQVQKVLWRYHKVRARLEAMGEEVSRERVAQELGVTEETVERIVPRITGRDIALNDAPHFTENNEGSRRKLPKEIGDYMADPNPGPEEACADREEAEKRQEWFRRAADELPKRERTIVYARARGETLAHAGRSHGISRERARQLETRAIETIQKTVKRGMR